MRLFIAIELPEATKKNLYEQALRLKGEAVSGRITRLENIHLTLVFIGESDQSKEAEYAMSQLRFAPFELVLSGLGSFRSRSGRLYWIGVRDQPKLMRLQQQLVAELTRAGIFVNEHSYQPHITIARQMVLPSDFSEEVFSEEMSDMKITVDRISLMQSESTRDGVRYTGLFQRSADRISDE